LSPSGARYQAAKGNQEASAAGDQSDARPTNLGTSATIDHNRPARRQPPANKKKKKK
jgi:hypothetical protein